MKSSIKKIVAIIATIATMICSVVLFSACGVGEKNITVVAREQGSGTREAFDKVVTDGAGNYLEMKVDGKKVYNTTSTADIQKETGNVLSKVVTDVNAIGYVSLGSVNDTVKVLKVEGVLPSTESVLDGTYSIQRPFVIMTNSSVTLSDLAKDFLSYLKSDASATHAEEAGCIFLDDPAKRGKNPIQVEEFTPKAELPQGDKVVINGSTSMEKFIKKAMAGYASLYGRNADDLFTLDLQGSSVGKSAVENDQNGNVIGLSSAAVDEDGIDSFNVCLDAVAVIVNAQNEAVSDLTLGQLYDIFSGKIVKFSQLNA